MQRQLTFRQYRWMDILFFTSVLCICEALVALATNRWFPHELYTLSLTATVAALVMVRWGIYAAIPSLLGAISFCIFSGARGDQFLIYMAGNLLALSLLLILGKVGWRKLHENVLYPLLYGGTVALLMQLGRMIVALILGYGLKECIGFITTDVLSMLFAALVTWICSRLDGMLEEQKHYLFRIQKEKEKQGL